MNPEFDYSKLNEKIIRTFLTRTAFCEAFWGIDIESFVENE